MLRNKSKLMLGPRDAPDPLRAKSVLDPFLVIEGMRQPKAPAGLNQAPDGWLRL